MKIKCFIFSLFVFCQSLTFAQPKNMAKFYRPSMSNVVMNTIGDGQLLVEEMKKVKPQKRFDDHSLSYESLEVQFPSLEDELKKNSGKIRGAIKEIQAATERHEKACQNVLMESLNPLANQAIAIWWTRDENGNMTDALLQKRGLNTATDADVIKDKASANSRLGDLGYELISRSYFTVYELSRIRTMEEVYNEMDTKAQKRAEKQGKSYTPVRRREEGYVIDYNAYIIKIDWNDSVQSAFWEYLWLDENTSEDRSSRKSFFTNTNFPLKFVAKVSGVVRSTQSNDPSKYGAFRKRLTMRELLLRSAPDFQEDAMFKASKLIEDFRLRSPLYTIYPTTIKLGSKEGVYIDQRFFAYQFEVNKKGEKKAKRVGVLRPTKIAENDGLATGQSLASKFKQQGGRKLYSGMFVEMKEDRGYSATIGFGGISCDISVSRLWKKTFKKSAPRLFTGLHLSALIQNSDRVFENPSNYFVGTIQPYQVKASDQFLGVMLGKEIYPFNKGKFYLYPQVGIGSVTRTFTHEKLTKELEYTELLNGDVYSKAGMVGAIGLGFHLNPWFSVITTVSYGHGQFTDSAGSAISGGVGANPMFLSGGLRIKI